MKKSYSDPSIHSHYFSPKKIQKRTPSIAAFGDTNASIEVLNYVPIQQVALCINESRIGGEEYAACIASPPDVQAPRMEPAMQQDTFRALYSLVRRVRRKSTNKIKEDKMNTLDPDMTTANKHVSN